MTEPQLQVQPQPQVDQQELARIMQAGVLTRRMRNGASTFYWIAALSLVNTAVAFFGGSITFVIGLGLTQWIDALAQLFSEQGGEIAVPIKIVSIVLDLAVMGLIALFGYFAGKGRQWAFIAGMVFYGLDALLFLPIRDWWSIGFHAYMLWSIFRGFQAFKALAALTPKTGADAAFPQDIGV